MVIDSNILIYSLNQSSTKHSTARSFLTSHDKKLVVSHQNILETLRILTHKNFPSFLSPSRALKIVTQFCEQFSLIYPNQETFAITSQLIKKYHVSGKEVFDAYLVATALSYGEKVIATDNVKHLSKYKEITVLNPFSSN